MCSHFSNWSFVGLNQDNSQCCTLHIGVGTGEGGTWMVIYRRNGPAEYPVASAALIVAGTVNIIELNESNLTGSVVWDGFTPLYAQVGWFDLTFS